MTYLERCNLLTNWWQRERMRKLDPTPTPTNVFKQTSFIWPHLLTQNRYMSITWRISGYIYTKLWFVIARPCLIFTGSLIKDQYNQGIHILQRNIGVITYLFWSSPIRIEKLSVKNRPFYLGLSELNMGLGELQSSTLTLVLLHLYLI